MKGNRVLFAWKAKQAIKAGIRLMKVDATRGMWSSLQDERTKEKEMGEDKGMTIFDVRG